MFLFTICRFDVVIKKKPFGKLNSIILTKYVIINPKIDNF